jgi:glycosyltransferase involved in cell wall biosynthesis
VDDRRPTTDGRRQTAEREHPSSVARRPSSLKASVLVVGYNESKMILDCIGSVLEQDIPRDEYEVIFVDNGSHDNSAALVEEHYPEVTIMRLMPNVGYPAGNNAGLKVVNSGRVVMLSADTVVPRGWLRELLRPMDADPLVKVCHAAMVIPGDPGYDAIRFRRCTSRARAPHSTSRFWTRSAAICLTAIITWIVMRLTWAFASTRSATKCWPYRGRRTIIATHSTRRSTWAIFARRPDGCCACNATRP